MTSTFKKRSFFACHVALAFLLGFYLLNCQQAFADPNSYLIPKKVHRSHAPNPGMLPDNETSECKSSTQTKKNEYSSYDLFFQRQDHNFVPCKIIKKQSILTTQEMSINILPHLAFKVLEKEVPDSYMGVVPFDLNGDGRDEYIVRGGQPSGGTQFYFLQKQNRKWKLITYFSGGFVLSPLTDLNGLTKKQKSYYKITFWHRYGMNETHEYELVYKNGEYIEVSDKTVSIDTLKSYEFLKLMRELNGFLRLEQWN